MVTSSMSTIPTAPARSRRRPSAELTLARSAAPVPRAQPERVEHSDAAEPTHAGYPTPTRHRAVNEICGADTIHIRATSLPGPAIARLARSGLADAAQADATQSIRRQPRRVGRGAGTAAGPVPRQHQRPGRHGARRGRRPRGGPRRRPGAVVAQRAGARAGPVGSPCVSRRYRPCLRVPASQR